MFKKFMSLVCCLAPFGVVAETIVNPDSDALVGLNATDNVYHFTTGNGFVVGANGMTVTHGVSVGTDIPAASPNGWVYVGPDTSSSYTILSSGNVSVDGALSLLAGRTLGIHANGEIATASFGSIDNAGNLTINDGIGSVLVGSIDNHGNLTLGADYINAADVVATGTGNTTIASTGVLSSLKLQNNSTGSFVVNADELNLTETGPVELADSGVADSVGNIQNTAGDMEITLTGDSATIGGNLENSGNSLILDAQNAAVVVSGTMKNDAQAGSLVINTASLSVEGGDDNNASFVNAGNVSIKVTGETSFANGVDLGTMGNDNTFSLTTGSLSWGNVTDDQMYAALANDAKQFDLNVTSGTLEVADIKNGEINKNAVMNLGGNNVYAQDVYALGGSLSAEANYSSEQSDGEIAIKSLMVADGATTKLSAAAGLNIAGNVSNSGNATLNASAITVESEEEAGNLVNNAGNLNVIAHTDEWGAVTVYGDVTNNNGNTSIEGREVAIAGNVVNKNGTTTIKGSDLGEGPIVLGGLDVQGGTANIDALIGEFEIANYVAGAADLTVSGGKLNIGGNTNLVYVQGSADIDGNVTAMAGAATGAGDVAVQAKGLKGFVLASDTTIDVAGNISAMDVNNVRKVAFNAASIDVGGNVTASGQGQVAFGPKLNLTYEMSNVDVTDATLNIAGNVVAQNGGTVEINNAAATVASLTENDGLVKLAGQYVVADTSGINITNGIWYDSSLNPTKGLVVVETDGITLESTAANQDINVAGGITVMAATRDGLTLKSADGINVSGLIDAAGELNLVAGKVVNLTGDATVGGSLYASGMVINTQDITNTGLTSLMASGALNSVSVENITNSGAFTASGNNVEANAITSTDGLLTIDAKQFNVANALSVTGGRADLNAGAAIIAGAVDVSGDLNQGTTKNGMLNLLANNSTVSATSVNVSGDFVADENTVSYDLTGLFNIDGNVNVADGAGVVVNTKSFVAQNLENSGALAIFATDSLGLNDVVNSGSLFLGSGNGYTTMNSLEMRDGAIQLSGAGLTLNAPFETDGMLYQNYAGTLAARDVNVMSSDYVVNTANFNVGGIVQKSGSLTVNSSDIDVKGSIDAVDLAFVASPYDSWMDVFVDGDVSGGVDFIGLEHMTINGNYTFDDTSKLGVAVLKYADGTALNSTTNNYWATVSLADDDTLGDITNAEDAEPLITVNNKFISGKVYDSGLKLSGQEVALADSQIGIRLYNAVDQGTAIWLLKAVDGIEEFGDLAKIRNLEVLFCNEDGTKCINYLDAIKPNNKSETDLPAYISVRDADANGTNDSLYVVFDPRFGGPVLIENMRIQPIVEREPNHTDGEYMAAGALDDLLDGQLLNEGFYYSTPIEVIPTLFQGTDMSGFANELYNRMEHYVATAEGTPLARFSRLVQPREIEQIAGAIALNDHTSFRDFEDRMMDEFIWNRNRSLKKAWVDVDYGMFRQNVSDKKRVGGNRFSVAGGFDWQESETLILGLTGRVSHMSSENSDSMDLSYGAVSQMGNVSVSVADTNIGLGGYLVKTLTNDVRAYGNAFLDIHVLDTDRNMTFMNTIDGDGTAFALTSEWGLMHDWLNQYIVGNLYARVGYSFGFSVDESAGHGDFMNMESDGYLMLTPGYTLTAQKRIYPSAWFQIRPYASIGVEYDVLGAPDKVQYKFGPAHSFTNYAIDIDPLWANIGGGFEMISATGIQFGVDYRYQYNDAIQLHNIKVSGSYRF